jgi:DNA repair exonuclease SbcCD ATPase subunit
MMDRKDETLQRAEEAFWAILAAGTQPTVETVNAWLRENGYGGRNRNVISAALKSGWAQLGKRILEVNTLPGIPEDTVQLVLKLRDDMHALAKREFEGEVNEIRHEADARVATAHAEAAVARAAAEEARQSKREADSAYLALQEEHQRIIGEAKSLRWQLEEASRQITTRDVKLGQAQESLEQEKQRRDQDRASAHAERQRLMLEMDQLRTANAAQIRAFERAIEKAQTQIDAAAVRERELRDENAGLHAEIGTLRGAQQVLKDRSAELTAEREHARAEAAAHAQRAATVEEKALALAGRLDECHAELALRAPIAAEQLHQIVADAYAAGANSLARTPKGKDQMDGLAERASDYAARHLGTAGGPGRARRTHK